MAKIHYVALVGACLAASAVAATLPLGAYQAVAHADVQQRPTPPGPACSCSCNEAMCCCRCPSDMYMECRKNAGAQ